MTRIIFACIIIALALPNIQRSQAGYVANAYASLYQDGSSTPIDHVAHTDQAPVSASLAANIGGTTATADSAAEFNQVHLKFASIGTTATNTPIMVQGGAEWNDSLFFKRNGVDVLGGTVEVTGHVNGMIDAQGLGNEPVLPGNVYIAFDILIVGGSGVGYAGSGIFDNFVSSRSLPMSWTAAGGLPVSMSIYGFVKNSETPSSIVADFRSTAKIVDVAYLGPDGLPDSSVTITSASGIVYGIPEPCGWILGIAGIVNIVWYRRPRLG